MNETQSRFAFPFWQEVCAFALAAGIVLLMTSLKGTILGLDGFFHIRMAELYSLGEVQEAGGNFHWTQFSLWNGAFSDKDFLWHIFLVPFVWIFGSDPSGLIHAAASGAAFASGLIAAIAVGILRRRGVNWPLLWGMLLLAASTTFIYRLCLPRSFLFSISAAMLGWHWIDRRAYRRLAILAALYTLAYTAPHVLFVLAAIWAFVEVCKERTLGRTFGAISKRLWQPFVAIALGIALGVVLHPEPINLLRLWVVQNLMVPAHANGMLGIAGALGDWLGFALPAEGLRISDLGGELNALDGRSLLMNEWAALFMLLSPWVYASLRRVRPRALDAYSYLTTLLFFSMMLGSERFVEYFYPFALLSAALLVDHANKSGEELSERWQKRLLFLPSIAFVFVAVAIVVRPLALSRQLSVRNLSLGSALDAVGDKVPDGEMLFHSDWGDFTQLFFANPDKKYLVGLDPTFFLVKDPKRFAIYEGLKRGEVPAGRLVEAVIREEFGMRYVFVKNNRQELALGLQRATHRMGSNVTLLASSEPEGWWLYDLGPLSKPKR